jgi:hypothetical protein
MDQSRREEPEGAPACAQNADAGAPLHQPPHGEMRQQQTPNLLLNRPGFAGGPND